MNQITDTAGVALPAGESGFDPLEERLRSNVRATIEAVFENAKTLSHPRRALNPRGLLAAYTRPMSAPQSFGPT
jgi:hypothetical protein